MRTLFFGSDLPLEFADPVVKGHLSFNGQLHFRCSSCGETIWGEVTFAKLLIESEAEFPCPNCRNQDLDIIRFSAIESRLCEQCGSQRFARPEEKFECSICRSGRFSIVETMIDPPYPSRLFVLYGRDQPFGQSPEEDTDFLVRHVRALRMSPQFHQTCVHLVGFIESIFERIYGSSADASNLLNAASGLMRTVYKETGNQDAAYLSIAIMIEGRNLAIEPIQRAVFGFNICQNVYSVLAREHDKLLSGRFNFELKEYGIWLSRQALKEFETINESWLAQLRAQQKWLLGDILKASSPSEAQINEALQWFEAALKDPALPKEMADYVRESALAAKAKRRNLTPQEQRSLQASLEELAEKYLDKSDGLERINSLSDLLRGESRRGEGKRRRDLALRCLGEAIIYTAANDPGNMLRHSGTILSRLVAGFAAERFDAGAPLEGIAGVEAFRSLAIDHGNVSAALGHHVHDLEVQLMTKALLNDTAKDPVTVAETMLSQYRESLEKNIRNLLAGSGGRFIVWCEIWEGAMLMAKIKLQNDELTVQAEARGFRLEDMEEAMTLPMADEPPGSSRAKKLEAAFASGWKIFKPLFESEPIHHSVVFVAPSILGGWPVDDAEVDQSQQVQMVRPIMFSPTIKVASAARRAAQERKIAKVLLVPYAGTDLPGIQQEVGDIMEIYGSGVTLLDSKVVGKEEVLSELSKAYDVIHFCGHGEFDYLEPLQSKIYFHDAKGSDGVITAADILRCGSIGRHPVVVLSACTSALVLPNGSNNYLGLAGALIRTGAAAIVGARWPILDSSGASFSKYFHARLAKGDSVDEAVAYAKYSLSGTHLDEWSAFMSIGG